MRKPFYKESRGTWYVEIDRKQINLGPDEDAAFKKWHKIIADTAAHNGPVSLQAPVGALFDRFLLWTKQNRASTTYDWYRRHLQNFVDHSKLAGRQLSIDKIRPIDVTDWVDSLAGGDSWKNGAVRAVNRPFSWGVKQGLIHRNPVAGMDRPACLPRECYMTDEQWLELKKHINGKEFLAFVEFLRETGCRPYEARTAKVSDLDLENKRITLRRLDSKGKKRRRVIRLTDLALELVSGAKEGHLLRNSRGRPWTKDTLSSRFTTLREKVDFPCFPYVFRHTWITNALLRGVDPLTVATLAGHKDATMVMRVYGHIGLHEDYLTKKLKQATEGNKTNGVSISDERAD